MLALLLLPLALAADFPVTLVGGYGASAAPGSYGGFLQGGIVAWPGRSPVGLDVSAREGLFTADTRMVGTIDAGARWQAAGPLYLRGGFAHHHETPIAMAKEHPIATTLGSLPGIGHRSGLGAGVGIDVPIDYPALQERLGLVIELSVSAFPDRNGPPVYVFLEQAWTIDAGKRRE